MPAIRIRIGASRDRSVDVVFAGVVKSSLRAANAINQIFAKTLVGLRKEFSKGFEIGGQKQAHGAEKAARAQVAAAKKTTTALSHEAQKRITTELAFERTAHREKLRLIERELRERINAQRRAQRAAMRADERTGEAFARRTSHRTTRFLMPNAPIGSMATRALRDIAQGAGVDFSLGGSIGRAVDLEKEAVDLTNQAFQPGAQGRAAIRQDPKRIVELARGMGEQLAISPMQVVGGLREFIKLTGDLETAENVIGKIGALARATGTDIDHMAAAAGNVSANLGDIPDKAEVVANVMRVIAGQGKLGAVEISDLATHMARIAAQAPQFAGDIQENIVKLGGLAQLARGMGGAPSAAEAARSVVGFTTTLQKGERIQAFRKQGVNVFADKGKTQLSDPFAIIKESLAATGGNLEELNALFKDMVGARAMKGLANAFSRAGGGAAGLAAVDELFKKFKEQAEVTDPEIQDSLNKVLETNAARAQKFQNELDRVIESLANRVLPSLEKAAPSILKAVETFASIGTWAVENPMKAIGAAISASITRAAIESGLRAGIERAFLGAAPSQLGGATGARAGALGKAVGGAGAALTIASVAVTTLTVGVAIIESLFNQAEKKHEREVMSDVQQHLKATNLQLRAEQGNVQADDIKELRSLMEDVQFRLERERQNTVTETSARPMVPGLSPVMREVPENPEAIRTLEERLLSLQKTMDGIKNGAIRVIVGNPEDIRPPGAGAGINSEGRPGNGLQP